MVKHPVIKYYGGKFKLAPWICSFFPPHHCYLELFHGAASVFMHKAQARVEIINDLNKELHNLFCVLRDPIKAEKLKRLLELTPYSREEFKAAYAKVDDDVEQARRTIVLATMAMNVSKAIARKCSAFRTSSKMHHRYPLQLVDYAEHIQEFVQRLRYTIIECRNYAELLYQHDSRRTLIYADPPYLEQSRSYNADAYVHEFNTVEEHKKLADHLHAQRGMVVISHYDCPQYKEWYEDRGWVKHSKKAVTGAAKKGQSTRDECIWLNPACAAAQAQMTLW